MSYIGAYFCGIHINSLDLLSWLTSIFFYRDHWYVWSLWTKWYCRNLFENLYLIRTIAHWAVWTPLKGHKLYVLNSVITLFIEPSSLFPCRRLTWETTIHWILNGNCYFWIGSDRCSFLKGIMPRYNAL